MVISWQCQISVQEYIFACRYLEIEEYLQDLVLFMLLLPLVLASFQVMGELKITITESCISGRHKCVEVLPSIPTYK